MEKTNYAAAGLDEEQGREHLPRGNDGITEQQQPMDKKQEKKKNVSSCLCLSKGSNARFTLRF